MTARPEKIANRKGSLTLEKGDAERTSISSEDAGINQPLVGNEELWRSTRPHDNYEVCRSVSSYMQVLTHSALGPTSMGSYSYLGSSRRKGSCAKG